MNRTHTKIRLGLGLTGCLLLGLADGTLASQPNLKTLFPLQADLNIEGDGLARLPLPPAVLSECRPDLSDLRVFDSEGREVPYLIDSGSHFEFDLEVQQRTAALILEVTREETRRDEGPPIRAESLLLAVPEQVPNAGHWDLVFSIRQSQTVRRVSLTAIGPSGVEEPLVPSTSIWRLQSPNRENLRVVLPALAPEVQKLQLRLEGEEPFYLNPDLAFESSRTLERSRRTEVPLQEVGRSRIDGKTIIDLERPRGLVPDRLLVNSTTPNFDRTFEVWDEGPGRSDAKLGHSELFRLQSTFTVEKTEFNVGTPLGNRLRIVVFDGDSPPLEDLQFVAVFSGPALLFSLPHGESKATGTLRFGGGRAFQPHYDLASLRPRSLPVSGESAELVVGLYDRAALARVTLGITEPNPVFDASPALEFAMRPGAVLDQRPFAYRRQLDVQPSSEGLNRLQLDLQDLAHVASGLDDLRIVDAESKQWAYLLEESAGLLRVSLPVGKATTKKRLTHYPLILPTAPVTLTHLVVDSSIPFFDRPFSLVAELGETEREIAQGRLKRRRGDPRPLVIPLANERVDSLVLIVDDGDDAPLTIRSVEASFPVPEIFFAAPTGNYDLLLGAEEVSAPRYELATVRDVVLALESSPVAVSSLEKNPSFSALSGWSSSTGLQRILFWIALGLAVLVLGTMTYRLARNPNEEDQAD